MHPNISWAQGPEVLPYMHSSVRLHISVGDEGLAWQALLCWVPPPAVLWDERLVRKSKRGVNQTTIWDRRSSGHLVLSTITAGCWYGLT